MSGAMLSMPACCVATKGVGSACSCLYSTSGTESARYEWLLCHGYCGIQTNKTGAGISKQPLPRSSHLLCTFLRQGAGEGGELPAACSRSPRPESSRSRRQHATQLSSQWMQDTSDAAGCLGLGRAARQADSTCLGSQTAVSSPRGGWREPALGAALASLRLSQHFLPDPAFAGSGVVAGVSRCTWHRQHGSSRPVLRLALRRAPGHNGAGKPFS